MRIYGTNGTALASAPASARRSAGGSFTVSEQETPRNAAAAGSLRAVSTVDALIALQGVEDPRERKKRAVAKGRRALDVLDTLKLGLLDGSVDGSMLSRLKVAAEGLTEETGDPGLDSVLGEIELRVAVELAKAGIR
jgi:hypothetical protein